MGAAGKNAAHIVISDLQSKPTSMDHFFVSKPHFGSSTSHSSGLSASRY